MSSGVPHVDDGLNSIQMDLDDSNMSPLGQHKSATGMTDEQLNEEGEQFVKRRLSVATYGGEIDMDA